MKRSFIQQKVRIYWQLMRFDKPIGALLLLWPTLCGLWLAGPGMPEMKILLVFILGVCVMRAAGCVINDYVDQDIDRYVTRTANRPLASGSISGKESKILCILLLCIAAALVLTLNIMAIGLSLNALLLACIYPFMKRITYLPQVVLGMAFSWSIPIAFAAVSKTLPAVCWLLLLANICWTVAYDTQYAMIDRDDDLKIGVKSTAILFGAYDILIIGLLQFVMLCLLVIIAYLMQLGMLFYGALILISILFIYQYKLLSRREKKLYFHAFLSNNYVGLLLFLGIALNNWL